MLIFPAKIHLKQREKSQATLLSINPICSSSNMVQVQTDFFLTLEIQKYVYINSNNLGQEEVSKMITMGGKIVVYVFAT